MDLFELQETDEFPSLKPLAERMRPSDIDSLIGQPQISGRGSLVREAIDKDQLFSMILWGPPGCGKTTLAKIIAKETKSEFVEISAVLAGVKDVREVIEKAKRQQARFKKRTVFFVDEIHRFNKAQQDAFLKHVETGLIILIGATTENPSFEVIPALLSRCRVVVLRSLSVESILTILKKTIEDIDNGYGLRKFKFSENALLHLAEMASGDVRAALNSLEIVVSMLNPGQKEVSLSDIETKLQKKSLLYDKSGEEHYNLISAFHKSLRGSDPDAALYWLGRMLKSGEDPMYAARRMVRFASEDIGMADNNALTVALNAVSSYKFLGYPEGEGALAQAAVYLATAPKSNSVYTAYNEVIDAVEREGALPVPYHIRNAPTKLMKNLGYNKGYKYAHNYEGAYVPQDYLPEKLCRTYFYKPTERGYESLVKKRLDAWRQIKAEKKNNPK